MTASDVLLVNDFTDFSDEVANEKIPKYHFQSFLCHEDFDLHTNSMSL